MNAVDTRWYFFFYSYVMPTIFLAWYFLYSYVVLYFSSLVLFVLICGASIFSRLVLFVLICGASSPFPEKSDQKCPESRFLQSFLLVFSITIFI